jgi:hypothetical protein
LRDIMSFHHADHKSLGIYEFLRRPEVFLFALQLKSSVSQSRMEKHGNKLDAIMWMKLDMNPYLDKEYFVLRKLKQGIKKLTGIANKVCDKVKKTCKSETMTMTNNYCPI